MKKFLIAIMIFCTAIMFTACSAETSFKTETTVSTSVNNLQNLLDAGDKNLDAGKIDDAIKNFSEAIEIDDECISAYTGRGMAYAMKKDFDAAIKDFGQTITLDPKYAEGYSNRGQAYSDKGDSAKAFADFNKAIEIDPKFEQAYINRGALYYNTGDKEKSIADLKKALEINPNNKEAADDLKQISATP